MKLDKEIYTAKDELEAAEKALSISHERRLAMMRVRDVLGLSLPTHLHIALNIRIAALDADISDTRDRASTWKQILALLNGHAR